MTNVDIFTDGKLQFDKPKPYPKPFGVYIGKNHDKIGYGQTGIALYDHKWRLQFYPDGEEKTVYYIIEKEDFWFTDERI